MFQTKCKQFEDFTITNFNSFTATPRQGDTKVRKLK